MTSFPSRFPWSGLKTRWSLVSLITLIYWVGPQSVRIFYTLQLEDIGASDLVIGIGVGLSSVAALLLAVPSGYLLDKMNSQRTLVVATAGLALSTGCFAYVESVAVMIGLLVVQGAFQMWVWLILQAMITRIGRDPQAMRQLSLFSLAWGVGLAAGPSVGAYLYAVQGFHGLSLACGALTLAGTLLALFLPDELRRIEPVVEDVANDGTSRSQLGIRAALRRAGQDPVVVSVMVSSFVSFYVQSIRLSFYPVFLQRGDASIGVIGMLLTVIGISSLVIRVFLPMTVRRFGHVKPLVLSTWVAIIGVSMTPLSSNLVFLMVGALMIGIGLGTNPPITVALLADAGRRDSGVAVGLRMVANRSAQIVQPLIFGGLAAVAGLALAFPASGVLLGGATVWMGRRLKTATVDPP